MFIIIISILYKYFKKERKQNNKIIYFYENLKNKIIIFL